MEIKRLLGNRELQEEGVWKLYDEDFELKLAAGFRNTARNAFQKEYAKARRKHGWNRELAQEKTNELTIDMILKHVLKDWRGLTQDGEAIPFSKEAAKKLLEQDANLRDFITNESNDKENYIDATEGKKDGDGDKADTDEGAGDSAQAECKSGAAVES